MKIERCEIKRFGKLKNFKAEFAPGLNLVKGPNEAGKTTLVEALGAGLFGDPQDVSREVKEKTSWGSDKKFELVLELEDGGDRSLAGGALSRGELFRPDESRRPPRPPGLPVPDSGGFPGGYRSAGTHRQNRSVRVSRTLAGRLCRSGRSASSFVLQRVDRRTRERNPIPRRQQHRLGTGSPLAKTLARRASGAGRSSRLFRYGPAGHVRHLPAEHGGPGRGLRAEEDRLRGQRPPPRVFRKGGANARRDMFVAHALHSRRPSRVLHLYL